jgi:serine protease Do
VIRRGKTKMLTVKIGALPQEGLAHSAPAPVKNIKSNRLGIEVSELTPGQKKQWDTGGVLVSKVNQGPGANAGLINGDVVIMVYSEIIRDMSDFERVVSKLPSGRLVPMRIVRRGVPMFISLRVND